MKLKNYTPPTGTECSECWEHATVGYTTYDEIVHFCDTCFAEFDNYEPPEPDYFPVTLDELHQKAFRQKYYGEGL